MICNELGGDIYCYSEWGKGTKLTFLIALQEFTDLNIEIDARIRNPK